MGHWFQLKQADVVEFRMFNKGTISSGQGRGAIGEEFIRDAKIGCQFLQGFRKFCTLMDVVDRVNGTKILPTVKLETSVLLQGKTVDRNIVGVDASLQL